jgi:hypothetical protein
MCTCDISCRVRTCLLAYRSLEQAAQRPKVLMIHGEYLTMKAEDTLRVLPTL